MIRPFARPLPKPDEIKSGFDRPKFRRLRLERFPRGADGFHIDVTLNPLLEEAIATFARALVRERVNRLWKRPETPFSDAIVETFDRVVVDQHALVVKKSRESHGIERVQLFQVAVTKVLLQAVDDEMDALRDELENTRNDTVTQSAGRSLKLHELSVTLARHASTVRFEVARKLFAELMRLERGEMKNIRKAVLGVSWPIADQMLANPVLQLDGVGGIRDFNRVYPILLFDTETMCKVNRCLLELFEPWLPENVELANANQQIDRLVVAVRRDRGMAKGFVETENRVRCLVGPSELSDVSGNWLDLPDNAVALLGGSDAVWPRSDRWHHRAVDSLQRKLNRQLSTALTNAGLIDAVYAAYELSAIYPTLGLSDAETPVFDFLKGAINRRDLLRRLAALEGNADPQAVIRQIETLRRKYRRKATAGKQQVLARFVGDFLRLRRDLKLAWRFMVGADALRLLHDEQEKALSRANNTLQSFVPSTEPVDARGSVVGHVTIHVDVRGVSRLVGDLRERNLNPAAHFSRHYYDPVSTLAHRFGALKVLIESDSLLFSIDEHGGGGGAFPSVARACCFARALLDLVDLMNSTNDRLGLSPLELGIGISYVDQPPTYLFDEGHRVMISPAILRAKHLAQCHVPLRKACRTPSGRGLCVAMPVTGEDADRLGESVVRYNVNGIELDAASFAQLHVEVSLHKARLKRKGSKAPETLWVGQCAEVDGDSHWLVIREQLVKLWMGRRLLDTDDQGRRFYEVVSERKLIDAISAQFTRRTAKTPQKKVSSA
ncbi:hypothetical protein [Thiosocius teredinicola]|uniref:hypothetical protein n=1 Tax=Thiosocius teredinicola TaxID=1973002 RepID=UPI0009912F41